MNSYDEECIQFFLENQLQLFPEAVAETPEEAEEFLDDCMAVVCDTRKEALAYLEEGMDVSGMSEEEILESEEGGKSWDNAREFLETICGGNEFALLSALGRYEKQKDLFAQLLPCLRHLVKEVVVQKYERNLPAGDAAVSSTALGQTVKTVSTRLSALQSMKILAIIDTALLQLKQNVNFNLILASFCAQLRQMM